MLTRRELLAAAASAGTLRAAERFTGPLGLEIYSLRREMSADVAGTLKRVRQFGFDEVEVPGLYGLSAAAFRKELDHAGLKATAYVGKDEALRKDIKAVAEESHTLGATYVIYPWIPHQTGAFSREDALRASGQMNEWGAALRREGLRFCYHPHGYEFRASAEGTLFDLIAAKTDKTVVNFQCDVFWVAWPGQDPVHLLRRYAERMKLVHLKDLRKGEKGDLTGHAPEETSVALGQGGIDFPAVLRAARQAGVERYYLEDEAPNAAEQIPLSLAYLKTVTF